MDVVSRMVRSWLTWCLVLALAVRGLAWGSPPGSDEGGLLLVGESWGRGGDSLYGPYWVDRPPLLVTVHELAAHTGGLVSLRLIGSLAAVSAVLAAWVAGRAVAERSGARWAAVTVTAVMCAPTIGWPDVASELLAVPFIIGAVALVLRSVGDRAEHPVWLAVAAGALAACAPLLKQNLVDGFLAIAVVLVVAQLQRRLSGRRAMRLWLGALAGAASTATSILAWSALRGTRPAELWQALVPFRAEAAAVISEHATDPTSERLRLLVLVCLVGGPLVIGLLAARTSVRTRSPAAVAAVVLLGWAIVSMIAGGSYWLHYLGQLAPGLSLAVAAAISSDSVGRRAARLLSGSTLTAAVASAVVFGVFVVASPPTDREILARWLERAKLPGDTAVVAWGQPDILYGAGMHSPYEDLWSLPVRVRDPDLARFTSLLQDSRAPEWVVTRGHSPDSWGIDASTADRVLEERYDVVADLRGYRVHLLKGADRSATTPRGAVPAPTGTPGAERVRAR